MPLHASIMKECAFISMTNQLMLYRETKVAYCKNHTKQIHILWEKHKVFSVKRGGT
jgi:hypothetical protein